MVNWVDGLGDHDQSLGRFGIMNVMANQSCFEQTLLFGTEEKQCSVDKNCWVVRIRE